MAWPGKQRGVALLVLALILIVGIGTFVYARLGKWREATDASRKLNSEVLAQAKAALIGYVVKEVLDVTEDVPGLFPCPESPTDAGTTNEGRTGGTCSPTFPTNKNVGRLPWRTIGIDKLVDASGEPLWYAVSPNWVFAGANPLINAGTPGQLTFDGTNDVVAVIFTPGAALLINPAANQIAAGCAARAQSRTDRSHVPGGASPDYRDYLECQNATSPIGAAFGTAIVDNATNQVINDQAVYITAKDILNAMQGTLVERLQRTVAPLLSEYSDLWPSTNFLPYAFAFTVAPEAVTTTAQLCGPSATTGQATEGLLPLAQNTAGCISTWNNYSVSGSGSGACGPATTPPLTDVQCNFNYYQLSGLGALLFGGGATTADVTIQATAPHAAASFRQPLKPSDVSVPPGYLVQAATFTPQTDGDAKLSLVIRITGTQLCDNLLLGLVCDLLPGLLASPVGPVQVRFPQLANSVTLQGSKLSTGVKNGTCGPPYNLLSPAPGNPSATPPCTADPNYWFIQNEWYRYTYYAVAPGTSAAQAGGNLTITSFPTAYGNNNDKRFVLALVGPPLTTQTRPSTAVAQYLEGANAATAASPRQFAYQVFTAAGNDRIATCPFGPGAAVCN
jgi:hypothetical protein